MNNYAMAAAAQEAYWDEVYEQSQVDEDEPVEISARDMKTPEIVQYMKAMWCAELDFDEDRFNELMLELYGRFEK